MSDEMDTLPEAQLDALQASTVGHYNNNARAFWQGTRDHDVSQNYAALLHACPSPGPLDILDFGCGPGRDLLYFKSLGHRPVGLDGSRAFCKMAQQHAGCPVLHQQFLSLNLPSASFDGIFANASLFHVPRQKLVSVLEQLHHTLRDGGVLFTSNPRGSAEGYSDQRYGNYMEFELSKTYLQTAGFQVLNHYYRPPGLPPAAQPWLAIVSQKIL